MNHTVYLPGDISALAKNADPPLNLSRLLRKAVMDELMNRSRALAGLDNDYWDECLAKEGKEE